MAGLVPPIKGTSQLGSNLLVGYFDQQSALIDSDKTVRDHFHELFPALVEKDLRKTLGMYLFGGQMPQSASVRSQVVRSPGLCSQSF